VKPFIVIETKCWNYIKHFSGAMQVRMQYAPRETVQWMCGHPEELDC